MHRRAHRYRDLIYHPTAYHYPISSYHRVPIHMRLAVPRPMPIKYSGRLSLTFETVNSPLDWSQLESCLAGHQDRAYRYIVNVIHNSFRVRYDYSRYVVHQATCSVQGKKRRSSVNTWHMSARKAECWVHISCLFTPVASATFRKAHLENGD